MKKEEKQQKFGFFFGFLTDCKNQVKQIMQHVKNNSKNRTERKSRPARLMFAGKEDIIKIQKKPDGFIREFENDEACGRVERRPQRIKKETG